MNFLCKKFLPFLVYNITSMQETGMIKIFRRDIFVQGDILLFRLGGYIPFEKTGSSAFTAIQALIYPIIN